MTTGQFRQRRLPYTAEADLDLESLGQVLAFWRLQLGKVPWQQLGEDEAKVADNVSVTDRFASHEGRTR